jgi:uncharacterized protein
MKIVNSTQSTLLADKARRTANFLERGRGLMFADPLPEGGALVIDPCNSIHMFGMRYPLDIIFLDKESKVVFMYRGIKPWRMGRVVRGAKLAIELPEGVIEKSGTQVGDTLVMS